MDMNTLQYVVGEAKAGQPAVIRFFGRVTEETTSRFNDEFDFLENIIRPSCIRVLINSEGGSVLYGMSTYSTIANATVDTECIIEGVAALCDRNSEIQQVPRARRAQVLTLRAKTAKRRRSASDAPSFLMPAVGQMLSISVRSFGMIISQS